MFQCVAMEGEEVVKVESAQPAPAPAPAPVPELAPDGAPAEAVAVPPPKEEQLVEPAVPEAVEANGALEEVAAPSGPTDEDVREALKRLLGESDLSVVTGGCCEARAGTRSGSRSISIKVLNL